MPEPSPLSPAANAVLDAAFNVDQPESFDDCVIEDYCPVIAAALRAAVEQLLPTEDEPRQSAMPFSEWNRKIEAWEARLISRREFLAIATELENADD